MIARKVSPVSWQQFLLSLLLGTRRRPDASRHDDAGFHAGALLD